MIVTLLFSIFTFLFFFCLIFIFCFLISVLQSVTWYAGVVVIIKVEISSYCDIAVFCFQISVFFVF